MPELKEYQTKEYWNKRTQMYKDNPQALIFRDPRFKEYEQRTKDLLEQWATKKVLDICCGYGRFAGIFLDYTGWDFSNEMIDKARSQFVKSPENGSPKFLCLDVRQQEGSKETFDVVFEVNSLHSLGMMPEEFFDRFKGNAKIAVACLEADRFDIFQIYK